MSGEMDYDDYVDEVSGYNLDKDDESDDEDNDEDDSEE